MNIRDAALADAEAICAIYNPHILNTIVSFEETIVSPEEMARRIAEVKTFSFWLVAEDGEGIAGYAYASKHWTRAAYRHALESTVYVREDRMAKGLGTELYRILLARLREAGAHVVIGGISLPNPASVALHEKCGFHKVAHFEEVGFKFGRWIDVGYWQITLR